MQTQNRPGWRTVTHDGEGTLLVRRLADGREVYYGKWSSDGRQIKRVLGTMTERQAKKALAVAIQNVKPSARVAGQDRRTVQGAAEAMIDSLENDGAKASTLRGYRSLAKGLGWFKVTVDRIGPREVERFVDHLNELDLSPATRWQYLRALDATLKFSGKRGWASDIPKIEKPKGRRGSTAVRYLKPNELENVLSAYDDDPLGRVMRVLTLTAAWTGLRRGELLGLRWSALDFEAEKVHVDESFVMGAYDSPKSGHGRSVPLPARVARELRTLRLASPYSTDGDPVFTHPEGRGGPLDPSYVSKAFARALKSAGAPPRRFHDLRHTYAVHTAKAGIPLTALREWLGHADLATTSIYARYAPSAGEAEWIERAMMGVER